MGPRDRLSILVSIVSLAKHRARDVILMTRRNPSARIKCWGAVDGVQDRLRLHRGGRLSSIGHSVFPRKPQIVVSAIAKDTKESPGFCAIHLQSCEHQVVQEVPKSRKPEPRRRPMSTVKTNVHTRWTKRASGTQDSHHASQSGQDSKLHLAENMVSTHHGSDKNRRSPASICHPVLQGPNAEIHKGHRRTYFDADSSAQHGP